jgi:small subunit ribosomal protein S20
MPIIKSAKKRVRVAAKAAARNRRTKRSLKSAIKTFHSAINNGDRKKTASTHAAAQSALDKAGKKHVMHKNKVARKKRQLAAKAKSNAGASKTAAPKKTATKKPAAKKAAPKKIPAKKSATKKTTAKKK